VPAGPLQQLWQDHRDRLAVAGLLATFAALFATTSVLTRLFHAKEASLAESWSRRGERALQAGRAEQAAADYRNALAWSRNNPAYQLRLAQALLAAGRADEARAYLLTLAAAEPGHGLVNLELARLFARDSEVAEAHRRYHQAIYGVWEKDAPAWRRGARLELVEMLLGRGLRGAATVELQAVAEDLPEEAASHVEVGRLFERAGDDARALEQFRKALSIEATDRQAMAGAARATFALGRYDAAIGYAERAARAREPDDDLARLLATARAVRDLDPDRPRLASPARARRARAVLDLAARALERCGAERPGDAAVASALARLRAQAAGPASAAPWRDPVARAEALDAAAVAVGEARACPEPFEAEARAAWLLLSRRATG
jgi:tetratricopeptide (TPR) repeat protein